MAVVWTEGFDMYSGGSSTLGFMNTWTALNGNACSMAGGRFGGQSLMAQGVAFGGTLQIRHLLGTNYLNTSLGVAVFPQDSGDGSMPLGILNNVGGGVCGLKWNVSMGQLALYDAAGSVIATSGAGIIFNSQWYYIEFEIQIATATTGQVRVYMNGSSIFNQTNVNMGTVGAIGPYMQATCQTTGFVNSQNCYDDFYMTDSAVRLGERRIETLRPNADTAAKTWTPNSGTANFSRVNEGTADGDTSYVQTGGVGNADLYAIASLSSAALAVDAVNLVSFSEKTDAGPRSIYQSIKSGATVSDGSQISLTGGYARRDRLMPLNPVTGLPWTFGDVNGLNIGPKLAA